MPIMIIRNDRSVSLMRDSDGKELPDELVDAEIEKWKKSRPEIYVSHKRISEIEVPQDYTFRNAWKSDGFGISHDMTMCLEIQKNRIRSLRAQKLVFLDVEYMRAMEINDSAKMLEISVKKQALRDVTKSPELAAAKTPEELKSVIPDALK